MELEAFWLSIKAALASTLLILPPGLLVAWILARKSFPLKTVLETILSLPLILPPVAPGLILLKFAGRKGVLGRLFHELFDSDIVFTWRGVILAMGVMSFPFIVRTARVAFEEVSPRLEQVARTLGSRPWTVFYKITLPLAARGIVAGSALAFGRALGEFGATILVAGNIPGKTATISVSIYYLIQLGQDQAALRLVLLSMMPAFLSLWISEVFLRSRKFL